MSSPLLRQRIGCRQITDADVEGVADLLARGFPERTRDFWEGALGRLAAHPTPSGLPKFGYMLENDGRAVGVLLGIFTSYFERGEERIKCSGSSWYVDPRFRGHASRLVLHGLQHENVTYVNVTPAPHTLPLMEALGFLEYCHGMIVAVPAFSGRLLGARVQVVTADVLPDEGLDASEIKLLRAHADYGCLSLVCTSGNRRHPFIFLPRRRGRLVRYAHLVYCRELGDFVRFSAPLGRYLAWRGFPLVAVDANGPIPGLIGKYYKSNPKYFMGPHRPRLGDLTYSETAIFGF